MESFFKELTSSEETITIWAAIGATIILIFVIYIISKISNSVNDRSSSYIGQSSRGAKKQSKSNASDRDMRSRETTISKNSTYIDKQNDVPNSEVEHNNSSISDNDLKEEGIARGNLIQEITNADGTISTQIAFDVTNDEYANAPISIRYEYLETANDGQFRKLLPSDEKCFFRTWEDNGIRKFEFHGNVDKALANINAIFDDVCEIEGKQNGATQIENVEPGILDSKLKVTTPAKIKLS